jgi:serine/threonine protein kinase
VKPGCLSGVELRALLAGSATKAAQASAELHLNSCTVCRTGLESLAGSAEEFRTLRKDGPVIEITPTPLLDRAIREFTDSSQGAAPESSGVLDSAGILQYFSPSQRPQSLGRFGDYEILDIIASGGMGIVVKAIDTSLDRIVAIKVLAPMLAVDERAPQRFLREARSAAALRHDHVVGIFAVGVANDLPFIAMEYIDGESLADRLSRAGPLPFPEVLRLARETAAGLAAAHARGIIHRDIKPGNILIERSTQRVKITDFGLARTVDDTGLTRSGFIAGTPEYLSPEQAAGESLDVRSDLFSLGCLLYASCVGESPFKAPSTLAVLRRVADHLPVSVSKVNSNIPPWFSDIIERLLAKKPMDRFASADECLAAIEAIGSADKRVDSEVSVTRRIRGPNSRKRFFSAAVTGATLIVLLIGLIALSLFRPRPFEAMNAAGEIRGTFANFERALAAAPEGGTIQLRWEGERAVAPITLPRKRLTIRAAEHSHPVWVHHSASNAALTVQAELMLEGIEFHYGSPDTAPKTESDSPSRNSDVSDRPPVARPGNGSLVRVLGAPLTIQHCIFQNNREGSESFVGIGYEGKGELKVSNSGLYLGRGKAIVLGYATQLGLPEREQTSLTISNCLLSGSQCLWIGQPPGTKIGLRLERNTFKGQSLLFLPDGGTDTIAVEARNNLLTTAILIHDQRPPEAQPLPIRMKWIDRENLYAPSDRLIACEWLPRGGPRRLDRWPFASSVGEGSLQTEVHFGRDLTGKAEFRVMDIPSVAGAGPTLSKADWARFGANHGTVGPSSLPSPSNR